MALDPVYLRGADPLQPPYANLSAALDAHEALVTVIADLVPVAIDDVADLGFTPIDAGELAFHAVGAERDERSGNPDPARRRARRIFARLLLERLLAEPDELVIYPVTPPAEVAEAEQHRQHSILLNRMTYDLAFTLGLVIPPAPAELDPTEVLEAALARLRPLLDAFTREPVIGGTNPKES